MSCALGCVSVGKIGRKARACDGDSERGWGPLLTGEGQGLRTGGP